MKTKTPSLDREAIIRKICIKKGLIKRPSDILIPNEADIDDELNHLEASSSELSKRDGMHDIIDEALNRAFN